MVAFTHTRTAMNYSTTFSVHFISPSPTSCIHHLSPPADSNGLVKLELLEQWLWDIIDKFIYQFQVFCSWRSKLKSKMEDELMMLAGIMLSLTKKCTDSFLPLPLDVLMLFLVAIHSGSCNGMSCCNILLCWLLLLYALPVSRRHSNLCHDSQLYHVDVTISYKELST